MSQLPLNFAPPLQTTYYDSVGVDQEEKKERTAINSGQDAKILAFFQAHPTEKFTAWQIHKAMGECMLITSVRRSITGLFKAGYLRKLDEKVIGEMGASNNLFQLN